MEVCLWISWTVGNRSSIFPDIATPFLECFTIVFRQTTAAPERDRLIQINVTGRRVALSAWRLSTAETIIEMTDQLHPMTPHHLPFYLAKPGETDVLMIVMGVFLILAVLGVGNIYLRLHSLPERMAHKSQKLQFEIVAVLGLISLFTHIHIFWIAGLLLALVDLPDFSTPLTGLPAPSRRSQTMRIPPLGRRWTRRPLL